MLYRRVFSHVFQIFRKLLDQFLKFLLWFFSIVITTGKFNYSRYSENYLVWFKTRITLEIKEIINKRKYNRNFVLNKSITYSISFKIDIINTFNILWYYYYFSCCIYFIYLFSKNIDIYFYIKHKNIKHNIIFEL